MSDGERFALQLILAIRSLCSGVHILSLNHIRLNCQTNTPLIRRDEAKAAISFPKADTVMDRYVPAHS